MKFSIRPSADGLRADGYPYAIALFNSRRKTLNPDQLSSRRRVILRLDGEEFDCRVQKMDVGKIILVS